MSKSSVLIFNGGSVGEGGSCNVHNLQLGIMTVNLPGFHTSSMFVLLDRSLPIESAPGYAPVDRYALAEWIQRGDVIQVDCADISPETDTSYTGILQSTTAVNQQGKLYTNTCTIRLDVKAENHTESRYYRLEIVHDTLTDVWYLAQDVNEYTYILDENAENKVQTIDNNSEHYPSCPAVKEAIDTAVASAYHAAGPKRVAQLTSSLLVAANQGDVYNMIDSGTTTADFVEGPGCPIRAGDNVGICDVGGGVYKFDLLSGIVDLSGYLAANGDGSDVTASFTATSTRTNISTGEKLSVLFGKIAKWFSDLKALAFKDKVNTNDIDDDAVTADKVKDGETLPINITGSASHADTAVRLPIAYGGFDNQTGYRLLATLTAPGAWNDRICAFDVFETKAGMSAPYGQLGTLTVQIRNNNGSYGYGASYCGKPLQNVDIVVRSNDDHTMSIYAYSSGSVYGGLQLALASSSGYTGNPTGREGLTLYSNNGIQSTVSGNTVVVHVRTVVSTETGVGNATTPVYIDNNGVPQPCSLKGVYFSQYGVDSLSNILESVGDGLLVYSKYGNAMYALLNADSNGATFVKSDTVDGKSYYSTLTVGSNNVWSNTRENIFKNIIVRKHYGENHEASVITTDTDISNGYVEYALDFTDMYFGAGLSVIFVSLPNKSALAYHFTSIDVMTYPYGTGNGIGMCKFTDLTHDDDGNVIGADDEYTWIRTCNSPKYPHRMKGLKVRCYLNTASGIQWQAGIELKLNLDFNAVRFDKL